MATARDLVERAYRKIGVVADDEAMTAEQAANGIAALNMMMHGWLLEGIDVAHVDLQLADTFTLQPQFEEGTVYLLADRLAPDNMRPGPDTRAFKTMLAAAYLIVPDVVMPRALRRINQRHWRRL